MTTELTICDAKLTLKNGTLTVSSPDFKRKETDMSSGVASESEQPRENKTAPKTAAERQKELYERRKEAGWRKSWLNPATLALIEELGSIEAIPKEREALLAKIADLERERARQKPKERAPRRWWHFWRPTANHPVN